MIKVFNGLKVFFYTMNNLLIYVFNLHTSRSRYFFLGSDYDDVDTSKESLCNSIMQPYFGFGRLMQNLAKC